MSRKPDELEAPGGPEEIERSGLERTEARLDELAQRFDKVDWIELAAAVLLSLATIMAAWSAYQSTRWNGERARVASVASAKRVEATRATTIQETQTIIDVQVFLEWHRAAREGDQEGMVYLYEQSRPEFKEVLDVWLTQAPPGEIPPGSPFFMPEYALASEAEAAELSAEADAALASAQEANQRADNFVLAAVLMATVLFFAGVGAKFRGRHIRMMMLVVGVLVFLGSVAFIFSMPQNIGI